MEQINEDKIAVLSSDQWNAVKQVLDRLFDDRTFKVDERRDLANFLWAKLDNPLILDTDDVVAGLPGYPR